MARSLTLAIQILGDARDAQKAFEQTAGSAKKVEQGLGDLALPAGIALGAVTLLGKGAADAAAEAEQSFGALESVFGKNADAAKELARASASSVGLATADYAQMAAVLASQLRNMGVAEDELLPTTESLIAQGADMAAMFGGTTADAVAALSSLLRGERDPIERYGVSIKDATIVAEVGADKLKAMSDSQATAARTAATLALVQEQTAAAHGQFAREADTAAGAQQRATAQWENAQAALGEGLLPLMVIFSGILAGVSGFVQENTTVVLVLGGAIAGLSAAILLANAAIKAYRLAVAAWNVVAGIARGATMAWTAVQWLLNTALAANPIGIVVLAIAALVGALVLAYNKSEAFRNVVNALWRVVEAAFGAIARLIGKAIGFVVELFRPLGKTMAGPFEALVGIVRTVFGTIGDIVENAVGWIEDALGGISDVLGGVGDFLDSVGKSTAAAARATRGLAPATTSVAASVPGRSRLSGTITIRHEIDDPHGALARVPGGAAAVAGMLNRGVDSSGLYRQLQHAAGVR